MSPEERATKVRERIEGFNGEQICGTKFYPEVEGIIAAAILDAVEEEREACAKLCEANKLNGLPCNDHWNTASAYLAEAIRTGQSNYYATPQAYPPAATDTQTPSPSPARPTL